MVPEGSAVKTGQHTVFPEKGWYREARTQGAAAIPYFQKVEKADILTIQVDANTNRPMRIDLFGEGVNSMFTVTAPAPVAIAGNTIDLTPGGAYSDTAGTIAQLYTHTIAFTPASVSGLGAGIYWLRATFEWDDNSDGTVDSVGHAISEPLLIREQHENTILIDCRHTENDEHFIWMGAERIVSFRVDGRLTEGQPGATDSAYEDSLMDASLLSSYPYRTWNLETDFIPAWLRLKLHYALSCKHFMAERRGLTKGKGGGLEEVGGNGELRGLKATLRETNAANNWVARYDFPGVPGGALLAFEAPGSYPYVFLGAQATVGATPVSLSGNILVQNKASEPDWATLFNAKRTGATVFYGRFVSAKVSGKTAIYYAPHPMERVGISVSAGVLNKYFTFQTEERITSNTDTITAVCSVMAVQWDALAPTVNVYGTTGSVTSTKTASHTVPTSSTGKIWTRRVFYKDDLASPFTQLTLSGNAIVEVGGIMPSGLDELTISSKGLEIFDCNILEGASQTLSYLSLNGNRMSQFLNYPRPWRALTYIDLRGNYLSSASVDNVIINTQVFATAPPPLSGGTLLLQDQTPIAPPTAASAAAANDLIYNHNWDLFTD